MIITSVRDYYKVATGLIHSDSRIRISTFGAYAGVTHTGTDLPTVSSRFLNHTGIFLKKLREAAHVQLMIGLTEFMPCIMNCIQCQSQFAKAMLRLLEHATLYEQFEWRMRPQHHLKCIIYGNKKPVMLAGGRNLNDSEWTDVSIPIVDKNIIDEIGRFYDTLWATATPITEDSIGAILANKEISQTAINYLLL